MTQVALHEACEQLPFLIEAAINGDDVFIVTETNELVRLLPTRSRKRRQFGIAKGLITYMAPDFDVPLTDFAEYMS